MNGEWLECAVKKKLFVRWAEEIPADCDEAKAVNLVRHVHDS